MITNAKMDDSGITINRDKGTKMQIFLCVLDPLSKTLTCDYVETDQQQWSHSAWWSKEIVYPFAYIIETESDYKYNAYTLTFGPYLYKNTKHELNFTPSSFSVTFDSASCSLSKSEVYVRSNKTQDTTVQCTSGPTVSCNLNLSPAAYRIKATGIRFNCYGYDVPLAMVYSIHYGSYSYMPYVFTYPLGLSMNTQTKCTGSIMSGNTKCGDIYAPCIDMVVLQSNCDANNLQMTLSNVDKDILAVLYKGNGTPWKFCKTTTECTFSDVPIPPVPPVPPISQQQLHEVATYMVIGAFAGLLAGLVSRGR
ncbi:MAG: hypothetical protein JZD41_03645 [Thermoproteus sp.]|nr:hypothetical protein [Thermoproteus sp.]